MCNITKLIYVIIKTCLTTGIYKTLPRCCALNYTMSCSQLAVIKIINSIKQQPQVGLRGQIKQRDKMTMLHRADRISRQTSCSAKIICEWCAWVNVYAACIYRYSNCWQCVYMHVCMHMPATWHSANTPANFNRRILTASLFRRKWMHKVTLAIMNRRLFFCYT